MKQFNSLLLAGVLVLAATGLAADKSGQNNPQHMDPYVQGPANEARLIQEIRHKLVTLPYYGVFDDIGFQVDPSSGHVTLLGQVVNPINKTDAEVMVKKVEGVTSVTDNIEVLPLSANDERIRRDVYRAIYADPALSTRYGYRALPSIHIIVKNGNVRLEGVVANEADRNLSFIRANGVPGVFKVENDLLVEAPQKK